MQIPIQWVSARVPAVLIKLQGAAGTRQVAWAGGRQLLGLRGQTRGASPAHSRPTRLPPLGSINKGASTETRLSAWKTYKRLLLCATAWEEETQVTNFKTINSRLGEIYQVSGGHWQVDVNPQEDSPLAKQLPSREKAAAASSTKRTVHSLYLGKEYVILCFSFTSLEQNKRLRSKNEDQLSVISTFPGPTSWWEPLVPRMAFEGPACSSLPHRLIRQPLCPQGTKTEDIANTEGKHSKKL